MYLTAHLQIRCNISLHFSLKQYFPIPVLLPLSVLYFCLPRLPSIFASHNIRIFMIDWSLLFGFFNYVNFLLVFLLSFRSGMVVTFPASSVSVFDSILFCWTHTLLFHRLFHCFICTVDQSLVSIGEFFDKFLCHVHSFRLVYLLLLVGYPRIYVVIAFHLCRHPPHHINVLYMPSSVYLLSSELFHFDQFSFWDRFVLAYTSSSFTSSFLLSIFCCHSHRFPIFSFVTFYNLFAIVLCVIPWLYSSSWKRNRLWIWHFVCVCKLGVFG